MLLGRGDGTFNVSGTYEVPGGIGNGVLSDVNGDGNLDLVVVQLVRSGYENRPKAYGVMFGDGKGTLSYNPNTSTDKSLTSWGQVGLLVADFDGDDVVDILDVDGDNLRLLHGNGNGTFTETVVNDKSPGHSTATTFVSADFDGDGDLDLIGHDTWKTFGAETLYLYLNDGTGHFQGATLEPADKVSDITFGDYDADGKIDMALTYDDRSGKTTMAFRSGDGQGGFGPATEVDTSGVWPSSIVAYDANAAVLAGSVMVVAFNNPPTLDPIGDQAVDEGQTLALTVPSSDPDSDQTLTYSLDGTPPAGATIDPTTGAFSWTPTEAQGPGTYNITVRVTDNGSPARSDSRTFTVTVNEVNTAPTLAAIGDQTVNEGETLSLTASGSDADNGQSVTYSLAPGRRPARRSTTRPEPSPGRPPRRKGRAPTTSPCGSTTTARRP